MNLLYIHGMGGGGDSRIPSILKEYFSARPSGCPEINVIVRTYDFDPEKARPQIDSWVAELRPGIIVGESLGSLNAIRIKGIPHLLVSPSLNAPEYFTFCSKLALLPGFTHLLDSLYKPREGDRQKLHFSREIMSKYASHRHIALENSPRNGSTDSFFAFFGTRDHYRRSGIVSIRTYRKYFGDTYAIYPGTHFMEEEFIHSMLIPKIVETAGKFA